jgi:hypothetical protein
MTLSPSPLTFESSAPEVAENSTCSAAFAYTHFGVGGLECWRSTNHFPELSLVHDLDSQLACFVQLAARIFTGEQVVGLFAHA